MPRLGWPEALGGVMGIALGFLVLWTGYRFLTGQIGLI